MSCLTIAVEHTYNLATIGLLNFRPVWDLSYMSLCIGTARKYRSGEVRRRWTTHSWSAGSVGTARVSAGSVGTARVSAVIRAGQTARIAGAAAHGGVRRTAPGVRGWRFQVLQPGERPNRISTAPCRLTALSDCPNYQRRIAITQLIPVSCYTTSQNHIYIFELH